jgi:hypothetical protein
VNAGIPIVREKSIENFYKLFRKTSAEASTPAARRFK